MTKISAFIIAKNEETKIEVALKSLVSFCDEIVVVDTGSTDKTKEIALQYTDKIYDFKWINDFSAARNFALSKCTGEWIVWIDADDEVPLQTQNQIKELILSAPPDTEGFLVNYQYAKNKLQILPRIFRNNLGLEFKMPVHEYLDIPKSILRKFKIHPEIIIFHRKEVSENEETLKRNISILEDAIQKDPKDTHVKFYLGREYFNTGQFEKAKEDFQALLKDKSITDKSFQFNIYLHLGRSHENLNNFEEALTAYQQANKVDPRFAEPIIYQANIFLYKLRKIEEAKNLYEESLQIPKPKTTFTINPNFYHQYPKDQLHKIAQLNKPIALICGYYGKLNIGDELMLASLIQKFQPTYRIIAASYNAQITQKIHKIESVPHRHEHFDQALKQSEMVIIGGGTLFHDQGLEKNKNVEYYCEIIEKASKLNKKIQIIGVGVDEIQLQPNKELIKETFTKCEKISVRDESSKKHLIEYGIEQGEIEVHPDLAFELDINGMHKNKTVSTAQKQRPRVGINLCPSLVDNPQKIVKQVEENLLPFMKENKDAYEFIFIPANEKDLQYMPYFKEKLGIGLPCFSPDLNNYFQDYLQIIDSCDYIIAARYHMIILGMLLNKKTFVISYAEKTDNLIKEFPDKIQPFKNHL